MARMEAKSAQIAVADVEVDAVMHARTFSAETVVGCWVQ